MHNLVNCMLHKYSASCIMHRSVAVTASRRINQCGWSRRSAATSTSCGESSQDADAARPFAEMPGPRGPLGLGSIFNYTPWFGPYSWERLHRAGHDKYAAYGPIVRETIVPGVHLVWLFDASDIARVLNDSRPGVYPQRTSHLALQKYRCDRPHVYRTGGLLPTNGADWWRIRSELQKGLSSPQHVRNLLAETERITKEFLTSVEEDRGMNGPLDVLPELSRLNLELICHLAFDVRMNSFTAPERRPQSITSRLIDAAETTNTCVLPTDQGLQLWRWIETGSYRRLRLAQEFMESVAVDLVQQKVRAIEAGDRSSSMLEEYLANPKLDVRDVVGMASDVLLAGVDTTTYSSCFLLYHLARNPAAQQRVYAEAAALLPRPDDILDAKRLAAEASYARAVLKESLRLNPIAVGVGRNLNSDLVLGGYLVPKGTIAVTQNLVASRLEQNFAEPEHFRPERWLRNAAGRMAPVNPYLVLPFGHGMRACIARRLAEQSMIVLMLNIVRRYELTWCGATEHMDIVTHLINKPDQPVLIGFKRR